MLGLKLRSIDERALEFMEKFKKLNKLYISMYRFELEASPKRFVV